MTRNKVEGFSMKIGDIISKAEWARLGGLANPRCARITRKKSIVYVWLHK